MTKSETASSRIDIVEVESRLAALVRKKVAFADMPQAQREARAALHSALDAAKMQPLGPTLTVWRRPQDGVIDYAPGVFVPEGFEASGAVSLFTLPQGRAAHLRMSGGHEGLPKAWQSLFEGCAAEELELVGLNWEVYPPGDAPEGQRAIDLYALLA